jgi:hypothetical protein
MILDDGWHAGDSLAGSLSALAAIDAVAFDDTAIGAETGCGKDCGLCRIDDQSAGGQAVCEEAADALDAARRSTSTADSSASAE